MTEVVSEQSRSGVATFLDRVLASATSSRLLVGLTVVLYASGFINLLPTGSLYLATVLIDLTSVVFAVLVVVYSVRSGFRPSAWMWALGGLVLVYALLLFHGDESWMTRLTTVRNDVLYAVIGVYAAVMLRTVTDVRRVLAVVRVLGVSFAVFGILQFVCRSWLPDWLLVTRDTGAFSYAGTDIVRSTGLLGNTIIYANLMVLFVGVFAFRFSFRPSWRDAAAALIATGAVLLTFSRLAIAGAAAILLVAAVVWIVRTWSRRTGWTLVGVVGGLVVVVGIASTIPATRTAIMSSFLVRGLFLGGNASVQGSTDQHGNFTDIAGAVLAGPDRWIGLGIGTQSQHSAYAQHHTVITDGTLLSTLAEGGLVLAIAYGAVLVIVFLSILRAYWRLRGAGRALAAALGVYWVYAFVLAAQLNSAYFGKVLFITFWVLFGALMALSSATVADERTDTRF